nr:hypothetical protein [Oscillospiraceae bacterium]
VLELLKLYNPTLNFQVENLSSLPVLFDEVYRPEVERLVTENIRLSREDWDSTEESWDFAVHPLVQTGAVLLRDAFRLYRTACQKRIAAVQHNEERLNYIFAEIYGLTEELDCTPPESTMSVPDDIVMAEQLVSFAVGCLFGRYSLPGVTPLAENYLELRKMPLYLTTFLEAVYGREHVKENVAFLEKALGDTLVHYCMVQFYPSHCRQYHKRPLYWLASSGRQHTVYGLCYVHRMGDSPVSALTALTDMLPPSPELTVYQKRLVALQGVQLFPDDGIQANHAVFDTIFAKIR